MKYKDWVYLVHSQTKETLPLENAQLVSQDDYPYLTNKPLRKQSIYYEFTHISGRKRYLVGFYINQTATMYFYSGRLFYEGNISFPYEKFTNLSISGDHQTIGLSIDPFSKNFSVYYQNQVLSFPYSIIGSQTFISPAFREAYSDGNFEDTISINFGQNPFNYTLPEGYSTWIERISMTYIKPWYIRFKLLFIGSTFFITK